MGGVAGSAVRPVESVGVIQVVREGERGCEESRRTVQRCVIGRRHTSADRAMLNRMYSPPHRGWVSGSCDGVSRAVVLIGSGVSIRRRIDGDGVNGRGREGRDVWSGKRRTAWQREVGRGMDGNHE